MLSGSDMTPHESPIDSAVNQTSVERVPGFDTACRLVWTWFIAHVHLLYGILGHYWHAMQRAA